MRVPVSSASYPAVQVYLIPFRVLRGYLGRVWLRGISRCAETLSFAASAPLFCFDRIIEWSAAAERVRRDSLNRRIALFILYAVSAAQVPLIRRRRSSDRSEKQSHHLTAWKVEKG